MRHNLPIHLLADMPPQFGAYINSDAMTMFIMCASVPQGAYLGVEMLAQKMCIPSASLDKANLSSNVVVPITLPSAVY